VQIPSYGSSSSNNALESMRQMLALQNQLSMNHDLARNQQEQLSRDHEFIAQLKDEISRSKSETEKLRAALADIGREQGPVAQMQEEYRTYRQVMEDREEAYRRMWREEESRVKLVSEETKSNLKIVRDHLIGYLCMIVEFTCNLNEHLLLIFLRPDLKVWCC
jgi:hemerythrin-like domain-containing protein